MIPFVYTLMEGGGLYRDEASSEVLNEILDTGHYKDELVAFVRWPGGNMDFVTGNARVFWPDDFMEKVLPFAAHRPEPPRVEGDDEVA